MPTLYSNVTDTQPLGVGVTEFLLEIFDEIPENERICLSVPNDKGNFDNFSATPRRLARYTPGTDAWYFCISTVAEPSESGYLARTHEALRWCYCIVLDDIGTSKSSKAKTPPVEPSWKLESSKDNFQWGYMIEPIELTPENLAYVEGCIRGIAEAGLSDPGARGAYRIVRVPGSLHKTGFVSCVTEWAPNRVWKLVDLMDQLGATCVQQRAKFYRVKHVTGAVIQDPVYDWLVKSGHVKGESGDWVQVTCPLEHEHTTESSGTSYSPIRLGKPHRAFSCMHSHEVSTADYLEWVALQGGPDFSERQQETEVGVDTVGTRVCNVLFGFQKTNKSRDI